MGTRIELHNKLCEALGTDHVYFQPPVNFQIEYPCIVYERTGNVTQHADNVPYNFIWQYRFTYINRIGVEDELWAWDPYNFEKNEKAGYSPLRALMQLPLCHMETPYKADNMYHYPFTIYY